MSPFLQRHRLRLLRTTALVLVFAVVPVLHPRMLRVPDTAI